MARAPTLRELMNSGGIHIYGPSRNMDETQIHHLSISHTEPTLLGYLKNARHISNFSKYCELTQINSEHIHGHSQNMWRIYFGLNTHFSNKFFRNLFKVHSFIQIICIICFSSWFSQEIFTSWKSIPQETMKIFEVGFPKLKFSRDFPWKYYFLKMRFQKEFLIFLKNQSWFSDISKTRFSGFQFPKFWISFSKEFSYKFSIIFLRKFSKSEFSWQVFSFSSVHLFFSRILTIFSRFSFLQDFPNLYKLSRDFKSSSSEFPERLISIFFLEKCFSTPNVF